jgi:mannose-6-phosphate isomerase-like protein (cupin superfamily)
MALLCAAYPQAPVKLHHSLCDHRLLTLPSLIELASQLPENSAEYNPGNLPIGVAPEDVPVSSLSATDTIRSIEENGSWMVLKRIEQHPEYRRLLMETLAEIEPLTALATGAMLGCEGFIFISSPGSVTPFHFDPEHNILMQIRGQKTMTVFPADDESIVPPQAHEAFHMGEHHRNQVWRDEFASRGTAFDLSKGDAIYVPVKAPHWVKNGDEVSISLSITWRSEWSYAEADARAYNRVLRQIGLRPNSPSQYPASNQGKALAFRAIRRSKAAVAKISGAKKSGANENDQGQSA